MEERRGHTISYRRRADRPGPVRHMDVAEKPATWPENLERAVSSAERSLKSKLRRLISTAGAAWQYEEMAFRDHLPPRLRAAAAAAACRLRRAKNSLANSALGRRLAPVFGLIRKNYLQVPVTIVLVFSLMAPFLQQAVLAQRYELTSAARQLVGTANSSLDQKLTYDPTTQAYFFNKSGLDNAQTVADPNNPLARLKLMQAQAGGAGKNSKQLYSLELPVQLSKGITIYDNNTGLNFKLVPDFSAQPGKIVDGHLVYPIDGGQIVYTLKGNGLKEDIVLNKAPKDGVFALSYHLRLPAELAARQLNDGSIGVYSADPSLYGNISFGDSTTEQSVMAARKNSPKNNLVFGLPAPNIKQNGGTGQGAARFEFQNDQLRLVASHLSGAGYPLSIDPSVVVTSSSDFSSGNNEGDIAFGTNQINRGGLTGGTLSGGWTSLSSFTTSRAGQATVAYNGYMYVLGGVDNSGNCLNDVQYTSLNSDGTIGAWHYTYNSSDTGTTFSGGFTNPRQNLGAVAYNGYIYVMGGSAANDYNDVQYAPLNANGTVGTWQTTASFSITRAEFAATVYNGYLYIMGGDHYTTQNNYLNDVQYAPLNANGTVGTWQTTASFSTARSSLASVAYNGYLYIMGGWNGTTNDGDIQYAPINSNGTVGSWSSTSNLPVWESSLSAAVYNGYLYIMGGTGGSVYSNVYYASIMSNGTIGSLTSTASFTNARYSASSVAYNGYIYILGGENSSSSGTYNDTQYAKIDPAGVTGAYSADTALASGNYYDSEVAYNGYLYVLSDITSEVYYASINSDGSIGSWSSSAGVAIARKNCGVVISNGYLYVYGGYNGGSTYYNDVNYAPINSNGSIGTWATTASFTTPRIDFGAVSYNNYLYVIAGDAGGSDFSDVQYAQLTSNGSIATDSGCGSSWCTTTALATGRDSFPALVSGGYMYILTGYETSASYATNSVEYVKINSDGTLGTWQNATNFPDSRDEGTAVVNDGYIYVLGGNNFDTTTIENDVHFAAINSDGSLGSWQTTTTFSTARMLFAATAYNGYLYVAGGWTGSSNLSDVQDAKINNGGKGTTGSYTSTASFTNGREYHSAVAYNGYLYILGGTNGSSCYSTVEYAPLNSDGTLGTWANTTSFTTGRFGFGTVVYNGHVYIMGGKLCAGTYASDVQYAPINSDGTLGIWATTTTLPVGSAGYAERGFFEAVENNGYVYIMGGYSYGGLMSDVQYAPINSDGTLGSWTATTSLLSVLKSFAVVVNNGYMYVIGGLNAVTGATALSTINYAPINSDGTLGSWTATTSLPVGLSDLSAVTYNGYMYIVGGDYGVDSGSLSKTVLLAPMNTNGTVGNWTPTVSLGTARARYPAVAYKGYLYALGGDNGSSYMNDAQVAPLNVMARKGSYSKLVDLGGVSMLSSITYTGFLANGAADITYKVWDSSGSALTALGSASSIPQPSVTATCSTGGTSGRYVWVHVNLDDAQNASFPDINSTNGTNVQDFTVNYTAGGTHPPPTIRLRMGQTLQTGIISPLDTCGS